MFVKIMMMTFLLIYCQTQDKKLSKSERKLEVNNDCVLKTGWYLVDYSRKDCPHKLIDDTSSYYFVRKPLITSDYIIAVEDMKFLDETSGFIISFNPKGTRQWETVTGNHVGDLFGFILNDTLHNVGLNPAKISTGKAYFSLPNRTKAELQRIKQAILTR